ncbi:hypothetical protein RCG23_07025 [Neobacillus sp. PS3-34]|uniref:hypothetical protein n=1 Tax=Neobacillus sp. PS3-34 TaxID=3070678 RepID=UPI0027DEE25E|nr:hypothetical protein [Neobacillus sp. PS3-34]WML49697.1 hypothetical protein RCG23_07025 [Neobacillus sp. PS3-34]
MEKHICAVTQQMKQLHDDLSVLLPLIDKLDKHQTETLADTLNQQSTALMKSLLHFTS